MSVCGGRAHAARLPDVIPCVPAVQPPLAGNTGNRITAAADEDACYNEAGGVSVMWLPRHWDTGEDDYVGHHVALPGVRKLVARSWGRSPLGSCFVVGPSPGESCWSSTAAVRGSHQTCSLWDSASCTRSVGLMCMVLFPRPAPRSYVGCPRCGSPHAFVTLKRTDTQCSFCPQCQYLWDALRASQPASSTPRPTTGRDG